MLRGGGSILDTSGAIAIVSTVLLAVTWTDGPRVAGLANLVGPIDTEVRGVSGLKI